MKASKWVLSLASAVLITSLGVLSSCNPSGTTDSGLEQFHHDVAAIDQYLADHNIDAIKSVTGVRVHIEQLGTQGLPPDINQTINVTYKGYLMDANKTLFDLGTVQGTLSTYIPGWQVGIAMLPKGTKATLYIPSGYAYGTTAQPSIPANSNLIFEVTLNNIVLSQDDKDQFTDDTTAIESYLDSHSINAIKDSTGLRYTIENPGTGAHPSWYNKVKISYRGKILSSGIQFYPVDGVSLGSQEPTSEFDSRVVDYLHGLQIGLQKIGTGGKVILYVPSVYGFGWKGTSNGDVGPNTNLIFEVTLDEIVE